jgi:hypothetical protein
VHSFIHQNHILPPEQFGFRKQHSTVSQLTRIADFITHGVNLRKHTGMVLLDTGKAYDTVWLNGLVFKFIPLHLPDYLLFFLKCYFEGRIFTVHLNDSTSTPKSIPSGLPQVAVLSTTLFSLYLYDMPRPPHTYYAFYADDTVLSQSWPPDTISYRLSNAIMTIRKYFTVWKPRLYTHKTESILFSKRRHPPPLRPHSNPGQLCALDFGRPLSRPCAIFKTSLHPTPTHRRQ